MSDSPQKKWPYKRRSDGKIAVVVDSNAWDYLLEKHVDLRVELPLEQFAVFIPREVEIELAALKGIDQRKRDLIQYIAEANAASGVQVSSNFGFNTGTGAPQTFGGFGGTFQSDVEREFYAEVRALFLNKPSKGSGLADNQADAALGALSFFAVVITMERPKKPGPIRFASERDGRILFLRSFGGTTDPLRDLVVRIHEKP